MKLRASLLILAAVALAIPALADGTKLGEAYEKASPAEKLALISIARADKTLQYPEASKLTDEVTTAEVAKGKSPKEKLEILGKLRQDAQDSLKKTNESRKAEKKPGVSFAEPDGALQQAVALAYIVDAAGPQPSLEKLAVLKLVRDSTEWGGAHHRLVLAVLTEALEREKDYVAANHAGKLDIVKKSFDAGLMGEHERGYIEHAILVDWMSTELKAGKAPKDIAATLKKLHQDKKMGFFAYSFADGILKKM